MSAKSTQLSFEHVVQTDANGAYRFDDLPAGRYLIVAVSAGFQTTKVFLNVSETGATLNIVLDAATLAEEVTVTAARGETEALSAVPGAVGVVDERAVRERTAVIFPQLLQGVPGVAVQQTSTSQGSPFVRGLTGKQVVTLIDGVRYNNSTFRPGPNQFTALIEPAAVARIEVVLGPSGTQYGSDSFGGTINALTAAPPAAAQAVHGDARLFFASSDLSAGVSGTAGAAVSERVSFFVGGAARGTQDLRTGGGLDSRAAVTRFLGLDSRVLGTRLQDTKFQQYAVFGKFFWTLTTAARLTLNYQHSRQRGNRRYDELDGGNGNLLSGFDPQALNFFYARYEQTNWYGLDAVSATFSINSQRDDRTAQGGFGDPRRTITNEGNRTDAYGYTVQAATRAAGQQQLVFGAEVYDEFIKSQRTELSPVTGEALRVRPRYPDASRYTSLGVFVQDAVELREDRLRLVGGLRYSRFSYQQRAAANPFTLNDQPSVPDARVRLDDLTFNLGAAARANDWLSFSARASRGFRAPNVSDFGAIGLTSSGFEVTTQEANSAGVELRPLQPETMYHYEAGTKIKTRRFDASVNVFRAEIDGLIERRSLLLPPGAVGRIIGGQEITSQNQSGEVFTALTPGPVQARQNTGPVLLRGLEAAVVSKLDGAWTLTANTAYVRNDVRGTTQPARLQGFAPPWISYAAARWQPGGKFYWFEIYSTLAARQTRFSAEDVGDQRLGAARSRADIAAFFRNGAVARNLVRAEANGVLRLLATGETLRAVQDRLLPLSAMVNGTRIVDDATRAPTHTATAGFAALHIRAGHRFGERHALVLGVENILDKNYRINGSGVDAPGVGVSVQYSYHF